jgi:hypothetical protein
MPRNRNFSIVSMSCFMERASRSSFQTMRMSPGAVNAAAALNGGVV